MPSTITCWKIASLHPHLIPTMEIPTIVAHDTCTTKHVQNPYVMIIIYELVFLYDAINLFQINFFYENSKPFVKQSYATKLLLVFRSQCVIKYTVHSIHCAGEHTCILFNEIPRTTRMLHVKTRYQLLRNTIRYPQQRNDWGKQLTRCFPLVGSGAPPLSDWRPHRCQS